MTSNIKPWIGGLMLLGLAVLFAGNADDPVYAAALGWLVMAVVIVGTVALFRRRSGTAPSAAKRGSAETVTVCVRAPLLPVPSLKQAYLSMPDHCLAVLGIGRR